MISGLTTWCGITDWHRSFYIVKFVFTIVYIYLNNCINRGHEFEKHQEGTWEQLGKGKGRKN